MTAGGQKRHGTAYRLQSLHRQRLKKPDKLGTVSASRACEDVDVQHPVNEGNLVIVSCPQNAEVAGLPQEEMADHRRTIATEQHRNWRTVS